MPATPRSGRLPERFLLNLPPLLDSLALARLRCSVK
jgi:hypothetical protein